MKKNNSDIYIKFYIFLKKKAKSLFDADCGKTVCIVDKLN